ncbi:DUF3108 domain-containing protein [Pricia sp. S334]|uniref:DUF3108 domain-containing protein n=1 Tax=Pricia mediterranea TaxID=3076079 RepID=A0ABU3L536_9FLAO|nr:DUF3108 domain-containing protein [Pricia sp. S334]MDT7828693.1 DUF3108 domain-containing protein [Pricia sp. S334]
MKNALVFFLLSVGMLVNAQQIDSQDVALNSGQNPSPNESKKYTKNESAFRPGEWLKFRMHYGFLNASYATLHVKSNSINGKPVYHVVGKGQTTGFASLFFKVDDTYESYFGMDEDMKPYKFVRNINEGGYTKDYVIDFDHERDKAILNDKKNKKTYKFDLQDSIQDLLSAFYYLRNNYDPKDLVQGEAVKLKMLYDDDGIFDFKLKYLGTEILKTKFGKVKCYKFRPLVQSGRVFKEKESLTLWVSADDNRIPIRIQADLAVGSIKVDLEAYNGLKNQFKIIMD